MLERSKNIGKISIVSEDLSKNSVFLLNRSEALVAINKNKNAGWQIVAAGVGEIFRWKIGKAY